MRFVKPSRIFSSLAVLLLGIAVPAAVVDVWNQLQLRQTREAEVHRQATDLVSLLDAEHGRLVDGIRQLLIAIANTRIVEEQDTVRCAGYMTALRAQYPAHLNLYVLDRHGTVWCATDPAALGVQGGERAYIRDAQDTGGFIVGEYIRRRTDQRPVLPFAMPYRSVGDTASGVVVAAVDIGWLDDYVARIPLAPNTAVILTDRSGVVLAQRPDDSAAIGKPLPVSYGPLVRASGRGTIEMTALDGVWRVQAYSPPSVGTQGLLFVVGMDKAQAMAPVDQAMRRSLALLTLVLTLSLLAAWWAGHRLVLRPVSALAATADRWRRGDLTARARLPHDGSEMSALGRAFDAMADTVEAKVEDLERAHTQTLQAEMRLRAVVDTATDAVAVIDERGIVQSFNAAAERIFGYTAAEVVGRNVTLLMPEPHHSAHDGYIADYRRTGVRRIIGIGREVEGRHKDGMTVPLDLSVAEWSVAGQHYFTGIMRDITERKQAEEALRAAKTEAERANVAKSKFLAAASHDLRQPTQSLVLFLGTLKERLAGAPAMPILDAMDRALDGLRLLLDSFLDVSRLDAGLVIAHPVDTPLAPVLDRLRAAHQPLAEAKGLRLRVVTTRAAVRSDPVLLERVLQNLVSNALRFTERGGVVVGCRRHGNRLRVAVVDTGIGIAPDRQTEIFDEFVQLGNPERDRAKGLGLGLAVVRRLAHLLGHDLDVRSVPGHGSTFSVVMPRAASTNLPQREAFKPANDDRPGLVLVIDDEALVCMGLQALLEGWGYSVLTAGSVEEALHHLDRGRVPDAILTDYRLRGGATGIDAIQAVYDCLGKKIPATIVTGDTSTDRLVEARSGGFSLVHKPLSVSELRRSVERMLCAAE